MIYNTKTKKPFSPTLQTEFLISMGRPQQEGQAYGGFQLQDFNHKPGYKPCDLL